MTKQPLRRLQYLTMSVLFGAASASASVDIADTSQIVVINSTPNLLLIPDTSESMQEGLSQGRIGLDWENCSPGPNMPASCVAGAAYENSKASIVKRVSRALVENYYDKVNLGLMSYQQYAPSTNRDDVFSANNPRTVLWRLTHRPADVRFSTSSTPAWYQPNHTNAWDSPVKRFREPHPTLPGVWMFYNVAVPGYYRNTTDTHPPTTDRTTWGYLENDQGCTAIQCSSYRILQNMHLTNPGTGNQIQDPDSRLWFNNREGDWWNITLTDSMRARGVTSWGDRLGFVSTGQVEWRANASPGLGYLHVPLGGFDAEGKPVSTHKERLLKKLQPQRHDWTSAQGNVFVSSEWPLIAAGLTPLEGTMKTVQDYFLKQTTNFGAAQGNPGNYSIPQSCGINAAIWITDGLPSVSADGTALGTSPVQAMRDAANAIKDLLTATSAAPVGPVKTYVVGFALPPGVSQLFSGQPDFTTANPLDLLAKMGGTVEAFDANNEESLLKTLNDIIRQVLDASISSSGIASTSTELSTETAVFQSEMNTVNWNGDLLSLSVASGSRDRDNPNWRAGQLLTDRLAADGAVAGRKIFGSDSGSGFNFTTGDFPSSLRARLKLSAGESEAMVNQRIMYMRGSRASEVRNGGVLRNREGMLGHIVNSTPLYVPAEGARPPMLYVMANDGMLHAFHADTGEELFAFIPEVSLAKIPAYTSPDYAGQFLLDGQMTALKVGEQKILVGSAGLAGKSVFALNISNPMSFSTADVLWEKVGDGSFDNHLGVSLSDLKVVNYNGKSVIAMGNGYNSTAGKSALLLIDPSNGQLEHVFEVDGAGFGSPGLLDFTRNGSADFVYIGDYNGKLWRFRLNDVAGEWPEAQHIFTTDGARPITSAPVIGSHPNGGVMLVFGSGELISIGSRTSMATEYVYGIRDRFDSDVILSDSVIEQTIIETVGNNRYTSQNRVTDADRGWKLKLPAGERMMASATIRSNRVLFGSYRPDDTPCEGGGRGYYTQLSLFSGTPLRIGEPASESIGSDVPREIIILNPPAAGYLPECPEGDCDLIPPDQDVILIGEADRRLKIERGRQQWRELGR